MNERMFEIIAKELAVRPKQVQAAVELLDDGNTVPFIARYRKEVTGELQDSNYVPSRNASSTSAIWKNVARKSWRPLRNRKK